MNEFFFFLGLGVFVLGFAAGTWYGRDDACEAACVGEARWGYGPDGGGPQCICEVLVPLVQGEGEASQ